MKRMSPEIARGRTGNGATQLSGLGDLTPLDKGSIQKIHQCSTSLFYRFLNPKCPPIRLPNQLRIDTKVDPESEIDFISNFDRIWSLQTSQNNNCPQGKKICPFRIHPICDAKKPPKGSPQSIKHRLTSWSCSSSQVRCPNWWSCRVTKHHPAVEGDAG